MQESADLNVDEVREMGQRQQSLDEKVADPERARPREVSSFSHVVTAYADSKHVLTMNTQGCAMRAISGPSVIHVDVIIQCVPKVWVVLVCGSRENVAIEIVTVR